MALANGSPKRSSVLPDLPTTEEAGLQGQRLQLLGRACWRRPARRPRSSTASTPRCGKALALPEVKERLQALGADPSPTTPAEFDKIVARELKENVELVKKAGIKLQ